MEYAVGDSFPDGAKVVYDGANDTYTDLAANSSAYYYYVFARDEYFNYSAPAENIQAPIKSYKSYRIYTKSLTGACTGKKNVIENLELRFADKWQEAVFSSESGTIGGITASVSSNSEHKTTTKAFNVFTSGHYRSAAAFASSSPYDQTADNFIEIEFASPITLQGIKIKGGVGSGGYKACGPDKLEVKASSDAVVWVDQAAANLDQDTTASSVTHVWAGHKPDYVSLSYKASEVSLAWNQPNANTAGFILVRSETNNSFSPLASTSYSVGSHAGYDILYVGTGLDFTDMSWDNSSDYYYSVFAYDGNLKYAAPQTVLASVQDFGNYHRYYRIVMESLTGPCNGQKAFMTSIEVELSDVWQQADFSSKNGKIGSHNVKLGASSQSSSSWKPFMGTSYWRSAKSSLNPLHMMLL